jgi:Tat protein translocase TatB subunit
MPQIGPMEIMVVAVIAFFVLGPDKLPGVARQMGRYATELRKMVSEVKDEFRMEMKDMTGDGSSASTEAAADTPATSTPAGSRGDGAQPKAPDPAPGSSSGSGEPKS